MTEKVAAQSIGSRIRNLMVGILIGLLVIGFAIWGINDVFSPQSSRAVASVGKTEVLADNFERAFKRELEVMARQEGKSLSHQEAYTQGIHSRVLGGLIQQSVISVDADELGIGVNRRLAKAEVADLPVFKDELTGEFSEQKYESILAQNRITRAEFEDDVYRELRRSQTVPAIIGGVEAPADYATQRYKFLTEQRKASILTLNRDVVATPDEPSDEVLKSFIASLGQWYAVKVTKVTPAIVPNFEEMKDELNRELLVEYAQEKLYDITSDIEEGMDEGLNFEEIAKKAKVSLQSLDYIDRLGQTQEGVKMSGIAPITGVADDEILMTEIFTNDMGYETDLFQTSTGGFAAIRVDDVINSQLRPFEEVKTQATAMWKTVQIDEAINEKMLEVAGRAQTGDSLDDIAAELGDGATIEEAILVRSSPNDAVGPALSVSLLEASIGDIERGEKTHLLKIRPK